METDNIEWMKNNYVKDDWKLFMIPVLITMSLFMIPLFVFDKAPLLQKIYIPIIVFIIVFSIFYYYHRVIPREIGISSKGLYFKYIADERFIGWHDINFVDLYKDKVIKNNRIIFKSLESFDINDIDDKIIQEIKRKSEIYTN